MPIAIQVSRLLNPFNKSAFQFGNNLYLLLSGVVTADAWSCQGVSLPNDVKVAGLDAGTSVAAKFLSGACLTISESLDTGEIEFNLPPTQVFKAGDAGIFLL